MTSPKAASGKKRRVMVGAIGKDVHNLGVEGFADWMQDLKLGYVSVKLGPAVPIAETGVPLARGLTRPVSVRACRISVGLITCSKAVSRSKTRPASSAGSTQHPCCFIATASLLGVVLPTVT